MPKSNFDHLRTICADNEEALEFIDAAEQELKEAEGDYDNAIDEMISKEREIQSLERDLQEIKEERELDSIIRTPCGNIRWEAENLQHIAIFEVLEEKLKSKSPLEIEAAINSL